MGKKHKKDTVGMEENEAERSPKKNKKEEDGRVRVKIEMVEARPDKSLPLVAYFPSGYDPDKKEATVKILRHVKRTHRVKVVVEPSESSPVSFVGTNYSGEGALPQVGTYALGVFDKEAKTIKIVPIESNKIFRLDMKFDLEKENELVVEDYQPNFNFSTKKTEQSAKKEMALRAHRDSEDLNSKMADAVVYTKALEACAQASSGGRNVPPYDLSATTPHGAFPLEKIISMGERRHLSDIGELLQRGKDIKTEAYPLFVCNRIHKIKDVEGDKMKERLACIFSYINHLIKFNDKDKKSRDGHFLEEHYKLPRIISQKFNDMFANTESGRRLAGDKKDLLIRYVLVLTLFVDDFKTDFSDIARDLRMPTGELRPHFESLGCKFVNENKLTLATLPVPLLFPTGVKSKR